jgi:hypothetical protein
MMLTRGRNFWAIIEDTTVGSGVEKKQAMDHKAKDLNGNRLCEQIASQL